MSYLLPASLLLVVLDEVLVPAAALLAVLFREGGGFFLDRATPTPAPISVNAATATPATTPTGGPVFPAGVLLPEDGADETYKG